MKQIIKVIDLKVNDIPIIEAYEEEEPLTVIVDEHSGVTLKMVIYLNALKEKYNREAKMFTNLFLFDEGEPVLDVNVFLL